MTMRPNPSKPNRNQEGFTIVTQTYRRESSKRSSAFGMSKIAMIVAGAAALALVTPAPAMAAQTTYDVMGDNGVIVLEDVSLKQAVTYVAAPQNCGTWLSVVYGAVDTKAITKEVKEAGYYDCHILGDPIRGILVIGQASA